MSERRSGVGRWLAWLAYLLIGTGSFQLQAYARFALWASHKDMVYERSVFLHYLPLPVTSCTSLIVSGLSLLFWRRPAGLYLAFTLIWLAPVIWICSRLMMEPSDLDPSMALTNLMFIVLKSGVFEAAGCSAFLLGVPGIPAAYGLMVQPEMPAPVHQMQRATTTIPGWLGPLCVFLLLPVLSLIPAIGMALSDRGTEQAIGFGTIVLWSGSEMTRQAACLLIVLPLAVTAVILLKYRHPRSILLTIAMLWLVMVFMLFEKVLSAFWSSTFWDYLGLLPFYFGFSFTGALAWTAYLLNAPRIQALYQARSSSGERLRYE
jgi:hypothetical protein